jgi:hypothetical protein
MVKIGPSFGRVLVSRVMDPESKCPSAFVLMGLEELHPTSSQVIQTYSYTDIFAVSFTADEQTGVVVHLRIGTVLKKSRLFLHTIESPPWRWSFGFTHLDARAL